MNYDELMLFVVKQQKLTGNLVTCDQAGAFGFHLHRRLEELGINCGEPGTGNFIRISSRIEKAREARFLTLG